MPEEKTSSLLPGVFVAVAFAWSFGLGMLFFWCLKKTLGIRVSGDGEKRGLNVAEYEDVASWLDFIRISRHQDLNVLLKKRLQRERKSFK